MSRNLGIHQELDVLFEGISSSSSFPAFKSSLVRSPTPPVIRMQIPWLQLETELRMPLSSIIPSTLKMHRLSDLHNSLAPFMSDGFCVSLGLLHISTHEISQVSHHITNYLLEIIKSWRTHEVVTFATGVLEIVYMEREVL